MDSTQDKQTDAPGRAGELRQILVKIEDWHGYYSEAKAELPEDVSKFVDDTSWAGELLKEKRIDLALADLQSVVDTATRTAVTEALDKVAAELDKGWLGPTNVLGKPHDDEAGINTNFAREVVSEAIEAVRAVIAAGGEAAVPVWNQAEFDNLPIEDKKRSDNEIT